MPLKFNVQECLQSENCSGCDNLSQDTNLIHNRDQLTILNEIDPSCLPYYELRHNYEDQILEDGSLIPHNHVIAIQYFKEFQEVEDLMGCYACGGCNFILTFVDPVKHQKTVVCSNGWKGYDDGWQ